MDVTAKPGLKNKEVKQKELTLNPLIPYNETPNCQIREIR